MGKRNLSLKMTESVSLEKKNQGKFTKKVSAVKSKIKKGNIIVKEVVENVVKRTRAERGLVYIGHIPHGFYEAEMKKYFKQFGQVTNARVCRSERTGQSKGYGFVEFKEPEVAQVVANTMDNYLMFKRRLEAKYIAPDKQPKNIFRGQPWSETFTPYKEKLTKVKKMRNKNGSYKSAVKRSQGAVTNLNNKLKKLAALGINHKFQPINIQTPLGDTTKLVEEKPVIKKELRKESKVLKLKLKPGLISKTKKVTSVMNKKINDKIKGVSSKKTSKKLRSNLNDTKTDLHAKVVTELKAKLGNKTDLIKDAAKRNEVSKIKIVKVGSEMKAKLRSTQKNGNLIVKKEKRQAAIKAIKSMLGDNTLVKKIVKAKKN